MDFEKLLKKFIKEHENKSTSYQDVITYFNEINPSDEDYEKIWSEIEINNIILREDEEENADSETESYISNLDNSVKVYISQIKSIPLLSSEEEIAIGNEIVEGRKAEEILKQYEAIDYEQCNGAESDEEYNKDESNQLINEINHLKELVLKKNDAEKKLVESNLRLVISNAKHFNNPDMDFLDLIQDGNMGLLKAVEKYKPELGYKFSTYATWWIRQGIIKGLYDKGKAIRLPSHIIEIINKIKKVKAELEEATGIEATAEDIAARLKIDKAKIDELMNCTGTVISLDEAVGDEEGDATLLDFVSADESLSPESIAIGSSLKDDLMEQLNCLTDNEKNFIIKRFGLSSGMALSLEEVSKEMHISREKARIMERKTLMKLRKNCYLNKNRVKN